MQMTRSSPGNNSPSEYEVVNTIRINSHAHAMAFDSATKEVFVPTREIEDLPANGFHKEVVKPGSAAILVLGRES